VLRFKELLNQSRALSADELYGAMPAVRGFVSDGRVGFSQARLE
jgi:hypothetical protein